MNNQKYFTQSDNYSYNQYSHIYIEKKAKDYPLTKKILSKYQKAIQIECNHYKDIFGRYTNDYREQKKSPKLILATKEDNFLYQGSHLIQNQSQENFFYTPIVLNCIYDCHYCFLQGMYNSAYIVIFVNLEDFFGAVSDRLETIGNMFLSISYDTDLLAIEGIGGICQEWIKYANTRPNLTLEIRTKSTNFDILQNIPINQNILFTYTISPQPIIDKYELKTPSLQKRLQAINTTLHKGCSVSLVIDPIILVEDFEKIYQEFFDAVFCSIDSTKISSAIIGTFRMSNNYFKSIKKVLISDLYYDSYDIADKTVQYNQEKIIYAIDFVSNILKKNGINLIYTT